ncbi:hypothetical protein [Mesorhizobium sp. Cs1321R2N1]|uniref:hypothetical protein n=1 Tax=Mesorhizobium sp. Cs1321R2N1 TaxID=3015174 RepID=UPI00301DE303
MAKVQNGAIDVITHGANLEAVSDLCKTFAAAWLGHPHGHKNRSVLTRAALGSVVSLRSRNFRSRRRLTCLHEMFSLARRGATMTKEGSTSKPAVRSPNAGGLPHPRRDANATDAGAKPVTPKTAGASRPSSVPLNNPVANRNAGRPRQASTTPRPTDKPLD